MQSTRRLAIFFVIAVPLISHNSQFLANAFYAIISLDINVNFHLLYLQYPAVLPEVVLW